MYGISKFYINKYCVCTSISLSAWWPRVSETLGACLSAIGGHSIWDIADKELFIIDGQREGERREREREGGKRERERERSERREAGRPDSLNVSLSQQSGHKQLGQGCPFRFFLLFFLPPPLSLSLSLSCCFSGPYGHGPQSHSYTHKEPIAENAVPKLDRMDSS